MFRNLRRRWRRSVGAFRIRPRVIALQSQLTDVLNEPVELIQSGSRGRDSVFTVVGVRETPIAMVRLLNPYLRRKPIASDQPFKTLPGTERINQEFTRYALGTQFNLTPQALWRCEDALLSEYVKGVRLSEEFEQNPSSFWHLNAEVTRVLGRLHTRGVAHMDASLANTIRGDNGPILIDFEYAAAPHISEIQARVYDHLRLVESAIKMLSDQSIADSEVWLQALDGELDADARRCDLTPLRSALLRVFSHRALGAQLAELFSQWPSTKNGTEA